MRAHVVTASAATLGVALVALGIRAMFATPASHAGGREEPPLSPPVAWCAPELEPIAGGGCLALPRGARSDASLVVYFHGLYARTAPQEELDRQTRLAQRATARGFAVLAVRGRLGLCAGPYEDWYCWPSNERTADSAPEIVAELAGTLRLAESRAGSTRRYLVGFSNGGYFATLAANRGLLSSEAMAVAHAGAAEPMRSVQARPPMLLLFAEDDPSFESMDALAAGLRRAEWPFATHVRGGGHQLSDTDIDAALAFFARTEREKIPLAAGSNATPTRAARAREPSDASIDVTPPAADREAEASAPEPAPPPEPSASAP